MTKRQPKRSRQRLFRTLTFALSAALLLPLLASCGKEEEGPDPVPLDGTFRLQIGERTVDVALRDGPVPLDGSAVVYTRAYEKDGSPVLTVEPAEGRATLCVNGEQQDGGIAYSVLGVSDGSDGEALPIPYNGFVLSVPSDAFENPHVGLEVTVTGAELLGEPERQDVGTVSPQVGNYRAAKKRRILYRDPVDGLQGEGVYLFTADYASDASEFPSECAVAVLDELGKRCKVESLSDRTSPEPGKDQLVFFGALARAYAEAFLPAETTLSLSDADKPSSYSDTEALLVGDTVYRVPTEAQDCESIDGDGVYLTHSYGDALGTPPATVDRVDVIVLNDTVAFVGERNARSMLPNAGGAAFTFAGSYADAAEELEVGQSVETVFLDTQALSGPFVRIGGKFFPFDKTDAVRSPEGVTVLYTPAYGASTGANQYGIEIAISADGVVTEVKRAAGDMAIPENGYVLSIHNDSENFSAATGVRTGEKAVVSLGRGNYAVSALDVSGVNQVRGENLLIVYRGQATTGTNAYGYEILVDSEGKMVGESYQGDSAIPDGGYVLSGHGTSSTALQGCYRYGAEVRFDEEDMRVALFATPETVFNDLAFRLEAAEETLSAAKATLLDLDYPTVEKTLSDLNALADESVSALRAGDFERAQQGADELDAAIPDLQYALIPTHAVENRAVWYRGNEKSDDEVRATIERIASLNINAVYLESWYNGRFTGFSENPLILHTTESGDYDLLDGFVRIGHEYGIEVHAWVENFFIGTVEAQEQANMELAEHFKGRWMLDRQGRDTFFYTASSTHFIFLNPNDPEVRSFLLEFYREIVNKYDVDGIHLDYIRFSDLNYEEDDFGYNPDIVSAWQKSAGTDVDPATLPNGELKNSWVAFRQNIISSFVGEISAMLRKEAPSVSLSAAVYPRLDVDSVRVLQDCRNWVENGYLDDMYSMSYGEDNRYVSGNAAQFAAIAGDACFYSTGISGFGQTVLSNFALQMEEVVDAGADGVSIFALPNVFQTYLKAVERGAFRTPAVQATKLSETVSAQLASVIRRADSVYKPYAGLTDEQCDEIRSTLQPILDAADAFDLASASLAEKRAYCAETISSVRDAENALAPFFTDVTQRLAFRDELSQLVHWLTVSDNRLAARQ